VSANRNGDVGGKWEWKLAMAGGERLTEVEGIQGAGPQIVFWGGWLPKVLTMVIILPPRPAPPRRLPPSSLINIKKINR